MIAVAFGATMAAGLGLLFLHAYGLANMQQRAGLWLCEMSAKRRKREADEAASLDARWRKLMTEGDCYLEQEGATK